MAKGLLDALMDDILAEIFDEKWAGRRGEKLTARKLKLVKFLGRDGRILRNVYLPEENGNTTEIDLLYITRKGIFVFESKNYSGWIFGNERDTYWTATLPNGDRNRIYNPIRQNRTHMRWLRAYLGERFVGETEKAAEGSGGEAETVRIRGSEIPLFSIVVFSERCELKQVTVTSDEVKVIRRNDTYRTVRAIWDSAADVLTAEQVEEVTALLEACTQVDQEVKRQHVQSIQERYGGGQVIHRDAAARTQAGVVPGGAAAGTAAGRERTQSGSGGKGVSAEAVPVRMEPKRSESEPRLICPRCGSPLVLRTARRGVHAGHQFYGCSDFPKCRYTSEAVEKAGESAGGERTEESRQETPQPVHAFAQAEVRQAQEVGAAAEKEQMSQSASQESEQMAKAIGAKQHPAEAGPICPRCGSPLVPRTARRGANAGRQFYGCSAFPRCRYTRDVDS